MSFVDEELVDENKAQKLVKILGNQVEELKFKLNREQERNICIVTFYYYRDS